MTTSSLKVCVLVPEQCYHMKTLYDHGERTSPKACFECKCEDGSMECKQKDPNLICPPLPCPSSQQFSVPGECCKFCPGTKSGHPFTTRSSLTLLQANSTNYWIPGVDYCGRGHMCHVNATCINLTTTYACHCNNGYQGDGYECLGKYQTRKSNYLFDWPGPLRPFVCLVSCLLFLHACNLNL